MSRVIAVIREHPIVTGVVAAAVIAVGLWLVFGFFGFQTLFIDEEVSEANPFSAGAAPSGIPGDETSEEMAEAMNDAMAEEGKSGDEIVDEAMTEEVTVVVQGDFVDRSHPTTGIAKVITDGDRRFLRFENFVTDNGPDLNVYLATGPPDGDPGDFVDLGDLKGNIGDQNYEISPDVDLDVFSTVFIWCVRFSVAFGAAALS